MAEDRNNESPDVKEKETHVIREDKSSSNTGTIVALLLIALIIILFFVFGGFGGGDSGGGTENGTDINVETPSGGTTN